MIYSKLPKWHLQDKRIFVRADLNVPIQNNTILSDFRLQAFLPTLNYILEHEGSVVLATHIGRPQKFDPNFSTKILLPWFKERGYNIILIEDFNSIAPKEVVPKQIILLENLRFYSGEKNGDPFFAKQLAQTAKYYVNDGFGVIHRNDTSVSLLPYEFQENKRSIGFLIEKELLALNNLMKNPSHPFVAILGGKKVTDKIPLIKNLLPIIDTLLLCPAIVFSFLKSQGITVGNSLVDNKVLEICKEILRKAEEHNVNIIFPTDYQIAHKTIEGPLSIIDAQKNFTEDGVGISIGPKTIEKFTKEIHHAKTIFFNGAMGFAHRPKTQIGTFSVLKAMAESSGNTVVAGGDTSAAAIKRNFASSIDHLSTGGGATLAYLSGKLLPGLIPFEEK